MTVTINRKPGVLLDITNILTYVNNTNFPSLHFGHGMTMELLKACPKGNIMNCWEKLLIQETANEGQLIPEQTTYEFNILYKLATNNKRHSQQQDET
jgi:hypothetical protein